MLSQAGALPLSISGIGAAPPISSKQQGRLRGEGRTVTRRESVHGGAGRASVCPFRSASAQNMSRVACVSLPAGAEGAGQSGRPSGQERVSLMLA